MSFPQHVGRIPELPEEGVLLHAFRHKRRLGSGGAPHSLTTKFNKLQMTGEIVSMAWECFGDLQELEVATARKQCKSQTRTAPDGIADRGIALFVPPIRQWEADFGRVSEEGASTHLPR